MSLAIKGYIGKVCTRVAEHANHAHEHTAVIDGIPAAWLKILRYLLQSFFRDHLPANIIAAGVVKLFLAFFELEPFK